ncbi:SUKH-4 family immunity protein [Streptomyces lunaelactis]|uniref:SUKH-4 family immunity protein n=1 Tax=Streptomyces lunaelactis TaxID=1535768 RepID=UPI001584782C|nr:SUKH-4 family immunity protein [Streptomyces lunaelactis]NUL02560.1 SUKH-4 family immunity protein [Streptomyces lunaelactis]
MLTHIPASTVIETFGLTAVTYFPRTAGGHLHEPTARFLSCVGLPENSFYSPRLDLENQASPRLSNSPTLKAHFEAGGAECPPEAEGWEVLGGFIYATVALDPRDGKIYAFPEGEEFYVPMHADASSLVHSLIVLEQGKADYKNLPHDDEGAAGAEAAERMKQRITEVDPTPFESADSEWEKLFEEISFGMWG